MRVPYTSCGDPGHRVDFARPVIGPLPMLALLGAPLPADTDLVILPGSKATIADLAALRAFGWDADIIAHHRRGGRVLGLCGGYQMLGHSVSDPDGIEGPPGSGDGLGLIEKAAVKSDAVGCISAEGFIGSDARGENAFGTKTGIRLQ